MSVVINMNKMRKAMERAKERSAADANALKFGRTLAQKNAETLVQRKSRIWLDGHERDRE